MFLTVLVDWDFRGAPSPMAYLDRMLSAKAAWTVSDRDLFARRCIEVGRIKGISELTVTFLDLPSDQQFLRSKYPGIRLGEEFTGLKALAGEMLGSFRA